MNKVMVMALVSLLLASCSTPDAVPVGSWEPAYDRPWSEVCAAYRYEPKRPAVVIREDCRDCREALCFPAAESPTGWAAGRFTPQSYLVELCPDLAAIRHEFSHAVGWKLYGTNVENGSGKPYMSIALVP